MNDTSRNYLLVLSLLEGAAVMTVELLGAKMVAPYFGTSLHSWAAVLGITLTALTSGYYLGGYLTVRNQKISLLYFILALAGVLLLLMPVISTFTMRSLVDAELNTGLLVSLFIFMLPPLLCMGMVSPIIIFHLTKERQSSGRSAGLVYAVSTVGGIIATFLLGFAVIPKFGVKMPAVIYGSILAMPPLYSLLKARQSKAYILLPVLVMALFGQFSQPVKNKTGKYQVRFKSEGLLGQVKVIDASEPRGDGVLNYRFLLVNNTWQTTVVNNPPYFSLFEYPYYVYPLINSFRPHSKALVMGLGGGSLVKEFQKAQYNVTVIDIDERLKDVAVKYFDLPRNTNVVIDDARHYLNKEQQHYDVIVFDCFLAETPPAHLLTIEAFEKAKSLLNPGGIILVEFYGWLTGEQGRGPRSLYKTLMSAGLHTHVIQTQQAEDVKRNFIYVASPAPFDFSRLEPVTFAYNEKHKDWKDILLDTRSIDVNDAEVLTDENPVLENMLSGPIREWRKSLNDIFSKEIIAEDLPVFY